MEWTDQHDVLMLREMIVSDEKLNQIHSPQFRIKDKRGVRERWELLRRKFKSKNREEEAASGIAVEDLTEKEALIEALIAREETAKPDDNLSVQQKKDKDKAEDIRKKAMESMGETKKRKLSRGSTDDDQPCDKKTTTANKRCAQPMVDFLRENANAERELRQQELEIRRRDQEKQQEIIQSMMLQQQQMNQAFISVVKKLLEK